MPTGKILSEKSGRKDYGVPTGRSCVKAKEKTEVNMKKFIRILRKAFAMPLMLAIRAIDDIDIDELTRAVDKRVARAESAVLRDYFAQHGIEGDDVEIATEQYRARRRETAVDDEQSRKLKERAETAERDAEKARVSAQTLVQMARMGVPESCERDVYLLVSAQLENSEEKGEGAVREAVESVLARLPGIVAQPVSSGSRGSFPRQDDATVVWQSQLDRARASGDNAAAVGIITAAAQKGIIIR